MKVIATKAATAVIALLAAGLFTGAAAQSKSVITGSELQTVLANAGLSPTMTEDAASGAPVAYGKAGDVTFWVRALDCSGRPPACENLVFFANFALGRDITTNDVVVLNRFNEKQVFGRAYFIEATGEIGVDFVIDLGGGVSMEYLTKNVGRWTDVVGAFLDNFRSGQKSS